MEKRNISNDILMMVNYALAALFLLMTIGVIYDAINFIHNPEDYRSAHHFQDKPLNLHSREFRIYLIQSVGLIIYFLVLFLGAMRFANRAKRDDFLSILYLILVVAHVVKIIFFPVEDC